MCRLISQQIHNARVKVIPQALKPLTILRSSQDGSEIMRAKKLFIFSLVCEDKAKYILQQPQMADTKTSAANNIAVLDFNTTKSLLEIAHICSFEAYSSSEEWNLIIDGKNSIEKSICIFIDIVLYGPLDGYQMVGDILTTQKIFLQEPDYKKSGINYRNPHFLDLSAVQPITVDLARKLSIEPGLDGHFDLSEEDITSQALLKQKIATAFSNMTRAQNLTRIAADIRIRTRLLP